MYYVSYYTYAWDGLSVNEMTDLSVDCGSGTDASVCSFTSGLGALATYDIDSGSSQGGSDATSLLWFYLSFNLAACLSFVFLDFSRESHSELPDFTEELSVFAPPAATESAPATSDGSCSGTGWLPTRSDDVFFPGPVLHD